MLKMLNVFGAVIADLYTPLIIMYSVILLRKTYLSTQFWCAITTIIQSVVFVYTLMFVDEKLSIWPYFGLDYSTHTAIALVFVIHHYYSQAKYKSYSVLLFILYLILMKLMGYHSFLDMWTTSGIIIPIIVFLWKKQKANLEL